MLALRDLCCRPVLGVSIQGLEVQIETHGGQTRTNFANPQPRAPVCYVLGFSISVVPSHGMLQHAW